MCLSVTCNALEATHTQKHTHCTFAGTPGLPAHENDITHRLAAPVKTLEEKQILKQNGTILCYLVIAHTLRKHSQREHVIFAVMIV